MSASAPPGWYDTGVPGEQGWWDGLAWTPHRRPAAAVPPPPAPVTPVAVPAAGTAPASATPAVTAAPAPAPGGVPSTWGRGNPVVSLVAGIVAAVIAGFLSLVGLLLLFFGASPGMLLGLFVAFLALAALTVVAFVNASAGFARRRVATPPAP